MFAADMEVGDIIIALGIAIVLGWPLIWWLRRYGNSLEASLQAVRQLLTVQGWTEIPPTTQPKVQLGPFTIEPLIAGHGAWHGRPVQFGLTRLPADNENTIRIAYLSIELAQAADGWARLRDENSYFRGLIPETDLESVEFNRRVQVHAHPKQLAFALFPPDFLAWYLRQSPKPWIEIRNNTLNLAQEEPVTVHRLQLFLDQAENVYHAIVHSGAFSTPPGTD